MSTEEGYTDWKARECDAFLKTTNWRSTAMENGRLYYYDKVSKKSQWKKPDELSEFENTLTFEKFKASINDVAKHEMVAAGTESTAGAVKLQEQPVQQELTKEELEAILDGKDSILEPNIISIAKKLLQKNTSPGTVVEKLSSSYSGYPLMIKIILDCIKLAKILEITQTQQNTSKLNSNFVNTTAHAKIESIASNTYNDEVLVPILSDIISHRFNRKTADSLVSNNKNNQSSSIIPVYVHNLIKDKSFKEVLQDLYQINEHSVLLKACCTGAYLVDTEDGLIASEFAASKENAEAQQSKAEAVLIDLIGFRLVTDILTTAPPTAWSSSSPEALDRLQLLVSESSETVKFYLLQQLQQSHPHNIISSTSVNTGSVIDTSKTLGKRCRPAAPDLEEGATNTNGDNNSGEDSDEDVWGAAKRSRLSDAESAQQDKSESKVEDSALIPRTVSMVNAAETLASLCEPVSSDGTLFSENVIEMSRIYRAILTIDSSSPAVTSGMSELEKGHRAEARRSLLAHPVWRVLAGALDRNALSSTEFNELFTLSKLQGCDLFLTHPAVQSLLFTHCLRKDVVNTTTSSSSTNVTVATTAATAEALGVCDGLLHTEHTLTAAQALCRDIQETFYGVVSLSACEQLHRIIETSVVPAAFVMAWVRACATNTSSRENFFFGQTLTLLSKFISTIVAHHPLLFSEALDIVKLLWASSMLVSAAANREQDSVRASALTLSLAELQRELVNLAVQLVAGGSAVAPMHFLVLTLDSCDIDLVRHVLNSLLQLEGGVVWTSPAACAALIDLLHTDRAQEAVHSAHFLHEDRRLLFSTIQGMPTKLLTLSTKQKYGDLLHIYVIS